MKFAVLLSILLLSGVAFSEEIKEDPKDDGHLINDQEKSAADSQNQNEDAIEEDNVPEETLEDSESDSEEMEEENDNDVAISDDGNDADGDENEEDSEIDDPKVNKPYKQCKSAEFTSNLFSLGHHSTGKC